MSNKLGNKADYSFCGKKECAKKFKHIKEGKYDNSELLGLWLECSTCLDLEIKESGSLDKISRLKQNLVDLLAENLFK